MTALIKEFNSKAKTIRIRLQRDGLDNCLKGIVSITYGTRLTILQFDPVKLIFFLYEIGKNSAFAKIDCLLLDDDKTIRAVSIYDSRTKSDRIKITIVSAGQTLTEIRVPVREFRNRSICLHEELGQFINSAVSAVRI